MIKPLRGFELTTDRPLPIMCQMGKLPYFVWLNKTSGLLVVNQTSLLINVNQELTKICYSKSQKLVDSKKIFN